MADSAKRKTLTIWGDQLPAGGTELQPKEEIRRLLGTAQNGPIKNAGAAYLSAAEAVLGAVVGIEDHAGKILTIWKGPDADRARVALELMYATGQVLARKLAEMGQGLDTYAGYIPPAIAEVDGIAVATHDAAVQRVVNANRSEVSGGTGIPRSELEAAAVDSVENAKAQEALKRLNEKIRDLHITSIPFDVTYELPVVAVPGVPGTSTSVDYAGGAGGAAYGTAYGGSTGGGSVSGADGGSAGGGSAGGGSAGGGKQDDGRSGGDGGAVPGATPGDQPGGHDQPDSGDQPGGGDQSGGQPGSQDQPGDQGQSTGAGTEDGTAPPVIGAETRTSLDDATAGTDPDRTESAGYQPTTAITPTTIGSTPFGTVTPATTPMPTAAAPGVPSVIGSPNGSYASGAGLTAARGMSGLGTSGMPFMPMMGGGGAMGDESGDLERTTYLAEDRSAWNSGHDVTDPVIG